MRIRFHRPDAHRAAIAAIFLVAIGLVTPPAIAAEDDPGSVRVFGGLSMAATKPFQTGSEAPGFGLGAQYDLGSWFGIWGLASYQGAASVFEKEWDAGLEYDLGSMAVAAGFVARLNVAELVGRKDDFAGQVLGAFELSLGPMAGIGRYTQKVRGEAERTALVPILGLQAEVDIWFVQWLGLRFAGTFGWSLTQPIADTRTTFRSEVFLGPSFRF